MTKHWQYLILAALLWSLVGNSYTQVDASQASNFIVKPYLQLGDHSIQKKEEKLELFWITDGNQDNWELETKEAESGQWLRQRTPKSVVLSYSVPDRLYIFQAYLEKLIPGEKFEYRLLKNANEVFHNTAVARKSNEQTYRFALFGDTGANTLSERKIVYQTYINKPDLLILAGDIVYSFGCLSEYLEKFFPIFNNDKAGKDAGAPLLQSTVTVPVIGNHDIAYGDNKSGINLSKLWDALAFYQLWSAPLNGPLKYKQGKNIPKLLGSDETINRYLHIAGSRYPTMSNYSFDYGDSHWLVLDANPYMDWTNEKLRDWVRKDLQSAEKKAWKFVSFHQPGFSIDKIHNTEQRMRLLSDIFQECGVDIVFSGHAHNYQRSYPLIFQSTYQNGKPKMNSDGTVSGEITVDKQFDSGSHTLPKGVIYMVSGAGGAALYGSMNGRKIDHSIFTDKFNAAVHSLTLCDVSTNKLTVRQISENGDILDTFTITK